VRKNVCLLAVAVSGCLAPVDEAEPRPDAGPAMVIDAGHQVPDAGDCLVGTYALSASVMPTEQLVISETPDGGRASWFGDGSYSCTLAAQPRPCGPMYGTTDFWVQVDEDGYVIASFDSWGCQADWSGTLLEMEVAGQPVNKVTAHRE
jgi:hypothetical protein